MPLVLMQSFGVGFGKRGLSVFAPRTIDDIPKIFRPAVFGLTDGARIQFRDIN